MNIILLTLIFVLRVLTLNVNTLSASQLPIIFSGQIYPNPVIDYANITLQVYSPSVKISVNVLNQLGQKVSTNKYTLSEGNHTLSINYTKFTWRFVFLNISNPDFNITKKFLKIN